MPVNQVKANPEIRPLGPLTEADKAGLLECNALGLSSKETARRLGLSESQVTHGRRKWGIKSDPKTPHQAAASEAFSSKARRQRHERRDRWQKIYDLAAQQLEDDLTSPGKVTALLRGMGGMETEETNLKRVPSRDLRERFAALNLAEVALQKIDALEDDQGLARGLSMLEKFSEAATNLMGNLPAPREGLIQE